MRICERWKTKTFLANVRTVKLGGQQTGVSVGELPQTISISQIGGNILPSAQVRSCLDDVRGAGAVRKIQCHAGIWILDDAVYERRRGQSEPVHVQVTRAGLRIVTEHRKLLALERSGCPVVSEIELAAQLRPSYAVGTIEQGSHGFLMKSRPVRR